MTNDEGLNRKAVHDEQLLFVIRALSFFRHSDFVIRHCGNSVNFLIVLLALACLIFVAYRGYSVILFAPVCAMGAVLLTEPRLVAPMFTGLFMDKMVGFIKLYFPALLLGAVFGKTIELSGFSKSIAAAIIGLVGAKRAILSIVAVCGVLTYGGVSLF